VPIPLDEAALPEDMVMTDEDPNEEDPRDDGVTEEDDPELAPVLLLPRDDGTSELAEDAVDDAVTTLLLLWVTTPPELPATPTAAHWRSRHARPWPQSPSLVQGRWQVPPRHSVGAVQSRLSTHTKPADSVMGSGHAPRTQVRQQNKTTRSRRMVSMTWLGV